MNDKRQSNSVGVITLWLGDLKEQFQATCRAKGMSQSMIARFLLGKWVSENRAARPRGGRVKQAKEAIK